ncbi:hypothetical protein OPKNFCMD_3988 [Methylobacterium crusticola]|uniref:CHAP domain-containing protein n=1 Tax=Methylobacterium crusticola TaxID=1697972 RepID=A0ABQ4R1S0_9HYPH|nr:hypothetical protein [Methylobacterium crusticola]GJD51236.1 hypothetical protein OPKNFCMD_3988 [Methylobacterium crusticola]
MLAHAHHGHDKRHRLLRALDTSGVEHLWLSGYTVNWETGKPLTGKPVKDGKAHTHCSAFVAAIAMRLNVYILRPPEHGTVLLANAQGYWLRDVGAGRGWRPLLDERQAQARADAGELVVASYINPDPAVSGHIAFVRPDSGLAALEIAQAGHHNFARGTMDQGFGTRRWRVHFYAHAL